MKEQSMAAPHEPRRAAGGGARVLELPFLQTDPLSHAFFRGHALTFDFRAMRLVLTPPAPA